MRDEAQQQTQCRTQLITNLPYRRFSIGKRSNRSPRLDLAQPADSKSAIQPRYTQLCATLVAAVPRSEAIERGRRGRRPYQGEDASLPRQCEAIFAKWQEEDLA